LFLGSVAPVAVGVEGQRSGTEVVGQQVVHRARAGSGAQGDARPARVIVRLHGRCAARPLEIVADVDGCRAARRLLDPHPGAVVDVGPADRAVLLDLRQPVLGIVGQLVAVHTAGGVLSRQKHAGV